MINSITKQMPLLFSPTLYTKNIYMQAKFLHNDKQVKMPPVPNWLDVGGLLH